MVCSLCNCRYTIIGNGEYTAPFTLANNSNTTSAALGVSHQENLMLTAEAGGTQCNSTKLHVHDSLI
jgi:hypothetical protein